jgi:hypothetical protein
MRRQPEKPDRLAGPHGVEFVVADDQAGRGPQQGDQTGTYVVRIFQNSNACHRLIRAAQFRRPLLFAARNRSASSRST